MVTSGGLIEEPETERLAQKRIEKAQCISRHVKLSQGHDVIWKEEIPILALIMEEELLILDQDWLISNISEEIIRIYREVKIKIWPWVSDYLPTKYKNTPNQLQQQQQSQQPEQSITNFYSDSTLGTWPGQPADLLVESSTTTPLEAMRIMARNISNVDGIIPRNQVAEAVSLSKIIGKGGERRCVTEHIAQYPDNNSTNNDSSSGGNSSSSSNQEAQVPIDKPKPHGSLTYDALTRTIELLKKVRDRVFEFPPEILQKDQEIAQGWDTWASWMSPSLDLKYSKDWMNWFRAEKYRDIYGKHAAAVMSFSLTNLCANCSDEKNREWVRMEPVYANTYASYQCLLCKYQMDTVCPNCNLSMKLAEKPAVGWQCSECNGTVPMSRDLTREQVGDKSSIVIDYAMQVAEHVPNNVAFCIWYSDWIEPLVGGRKTRLSEDLSEKA